MSVLQFTIEEAYTANTKVVKYENGHRVFEDIIGNWALDGYLRSLISEGYEYAYDVEKYKRDWEEAKEFEQEAHKAYLNALMHPLMKEEN